MYNLKLNLFPVFICLILSLTLGCEKKEVNEKPTVRFLQPGSDLIITNDTVITFIAEPYDKDGTIDRVEFSNNGTIVKTVVSSPYSFEWNISTVNNIGTYIIKAIAYDNQEAMGEAEVQIEVKSYLTKWLGIYEGISHHWSTYPTTINGQWVIVTSDDYKMVNVNVSKSSQDTCLDFAITYNDSILSAMNELNISASGTHSSQWGSGSSYGSLNISFVGDTLVFNKIQKCGIPCNSGIDFVIGKK